MGRRNYLIEGSSGAGKTAVATELERRGYHVVHDDRLLPQGSHGEKTAFRDQGGGTGYPPPALALVLLPIGEKVARSAG